MSALPGRPHPDLNVGPLAEPLLARLGRRELRHFFPVQLQDARAVVPHHLGGRHDTEIKTPGPIAAEALTALGSTKANMTTYLA